MESVIAIITSLIGCITLFVKTFFGKSHKREREYYDKVLKPYVLKLSKNENLSAMVFVNSHVKRDDDYVPKYIFYILDSEKEEDLKYVLLVDYMELYPNDINVIKKALDGIYKVLNYVLVAISIISLFLGVMYLVNGILELANFVLLLVQNMTIGNVENMRSSFITGAALSVVSIMTLKLSIISNDDRYEIKKNRIEKIIRNKVKKYDKKIKKVVL